MKQPGDAPEFIPSVGRGLGLWASVSAMMDVRSGRGPRVDDATFGGFKRSGEIRNAIFKPHECAPSPPKRPN